MKHENSHCRIGPLRPGGQGKHHTHARIDLDAPTRVTNASSREPLTLSAWNVRRGGEDHKQFLSRGIGA